MTFSSSDFTTSIVNHLFDNGLITAEVADSDDLRHQAITAIAVINDLAERVDAQQAPASGSPAQAVIQQDPTKAARFMAELFDAHETLTEIGERQGIRTLADCMYMLSALQKGTHIEVHHPTESQILKVIGALPSAAVWMTHVYEVDE